MNIETEDQNAWDELQSVLSERIENAEQDEVSKKTFDQITDDVIQEKREKLKLRKLKLKYIESAFKGFQITRMTPPMYF